MTNGRLIKIVNILLVFVIIGMLLFEAQILTQAQDAPAAEDAGTADEEPPIPQTDIGTKCVTQLRDYLVIQEVEFGQFINEHFRSPKPTSELVPTAIEKFREFRAEAKAEMVRYLPHEQIAGAAIQERTLCKDAMEKHFAIMMNVLRQHMISNAYAKKSTRLLDKYKQINGKLEKLNFTIAQTYGYFAALSQKLPCYASKCVK